MRSWWAQTTGGLPRTFWYLWAGTLVNRIGSFVLVFLAIYLTTVRGFSAAQAGLVLGLCGAGSAVGALAGGVLADRWGRRRTLLAAHLGAAAAMICLGLSRELPAILASGALLGMFADGARPAFGAMMVDVVPERDRLRAFTLNYWAINLGFACASVLAGLAAQADFLVLFVVDAATTLATAVIVFARVPETRPDRPPAPHRAAHPLASGRARAAGPSGLRAVFSDGVFLGFVAMNLVTALVFLQHLSTLPIAMGRDGLSPATFGLVISLNGILIVAGQLFVPRLIGERSRSRILALAAAVIGVGFGLTAFADAAWLYAVTVLIWTLGEMISSPSNATLIAELSPAGARGRYQGVFSLSWSAAAIAAHIIGGYVQQHLGNTALWLACGALGGLVALAHLASGPARERRATRLRAAALSPAG